MAWTGTWHVCIRTVLACVISWSLMLSASDLVRASDNLNASWKPVLVSPYQNYIRYFYHSSVPASFRPRIYDGRNVWNFVGRELYFASGNSSDGLIRITYEDLLFPNGDALAISITYAGVCFPKICTGSIAYNTTPGPYKFYTGTGTPNGANNEVDLWSVAAHEWGHQVSLNHSSLSADTMWGSTTAGDTKQRTLTSHDIAGISALYPPK